MRDVRQPMTAVRVSDVAASLRFYVDTLGCNLVRHDTGADLAVVDAAGYAILIAGPAAGDITHELHTVREVVKPGGSVHIFGGDLGARRAALADRGVAATLIERPWGDRQLQVTDPDGYSVVFWTIVERTPEQVLDLYASGVDALERALDGLSEADLDLAREPGAWTIRQIVHHLADAETAALGGPKFALAEPGRVYHGNRYSQDVWAERLDYAGRDIGPSVVLFKAIRAHMLQLVRHVPDALERHTVDASGAPSLPVGRILGMLASHALEHIEEIEETRRRYGR
ncbi:MAG: DinB family protein [Sphaerobacter thermophilus]|uniref:DinB family protein n=1 Tax=Sphaerobacter thermophilus TaxID=2057 RepID=UPI00396D9BAC